MERGHVFDRLDVDMFEDVFLGDDRCVVDPDGLVTDGRRELGERKGKSSSSSTISAKITMPYFRPPSRPVSPSES